MLRLDVLEERRTTAAPFPHLVADGLIGEEHKAELARDFPDESKTGFFPVEQLSYGPAFQRLLDALEQPAFSRIVGAKLDRDLAERPKMIVARKWSAAKDGRPHTDGEDKVATALVYLNDDWSAEGGALRFLEGPDLDGPGTAAIPARYGGFAAFARGADSWHGHKPFAGERRVVQVFWLKDEAAAARKTRRHKRTNLFKAIFG